MKKRFLGLFLAVLMAVSMLSLTACAEAGESSAAVTEPEISGYDKQPSWWTDEQEYIVQHFSKRMNPISRMNKGALI